MISTARQTYNERITVLKHTISDPIVQDKPPIPANTQHNERARFLRNGLAIISFNILEDFIKARIAEVLLKIATSPIAFDNLPGKLQEATLLDSLTGIDKIARQYKKSGLDWKLFIQNQSQILATTSSIPYNLTNYGMGYQYSNLGEKDIAEFMSNFQIRGGWATIEQVTIAIGCTVIDPKQAFTNAANRRHTAAHNPNSHTPYADIDDFLTQSKAISLAFDFLISQAAHYLKNSHAPYLSGTPILHTDLKIRYVRNPSGQYFEMNSGNTAPIKRHTTEADAITSLKGRRNYSGEMLVVVDYPSKVQNWYTAF